MSRPALSAVGRRGPRARALALGVVGAIALALGLGAPADAFAQDVLVIGAPINAFAYLGLDDNVLVHDMIADTGEFAKVERYDARFGTPTLSMLENYHAVLVFSEAEFANAATLGDVLADYVRLGHGVVVVGGALQSGTAVEGHFVTDGFLPITVGIRGSNPPFLGIHQSPGSEWLVGPVKGHPSVYGVNQLNGGPTSTRAVGVTVRPSSSQATITVTAQWDDGTPAIIVREPTDPSIGRTAAVNINHYGWLIDLNGDGIPDYHQNGWFGNLIGAPQLFVVDGDRAFTSPLLWSMKYDKPLGTLENLDLIQDLDCDGYDVTAELDVILTDPFCDDRIDPDTNQPYTEDDWYYDYESNACEVWLGQDDVDGDQLVAFISPLITITDPLTNQTRPVGEPIIFGEDGQVVSSSVLECDNCALDFNPEQYDIDNDEVGDLCDNCPYEPNRDQDNICPATGQPDGDNIGVVCDNCICSYNPCQEDADNDGVGDVCDNCIATFNSDQADSDSCPDNFNLPDGWGDACDNCPLVCNPGQGDVDFDGVGDECDNCALVPNPDQANADSAGEIGSKLGDACDPCPNDADYGATEPDRDGDGVGDHCDNCPDDPNADQLDGDLDDVGDVCDNCPTFSNVLKTDVDLDGFGDACDVCPEIANPDQEDRDGDRVGDVCDGCPDVFDAGYTDTDGDGVTDVCDKCLLTPSFPNTDTDSDGVGDACDNCPEDPNPYQEDADADGIGDLCDAFAIRGGGAVSDGCGTAPGPLSSGAAWAALALAAGLARRRVRG